MMTSRGPAAVARVGEMKGTRRRDRPRRPLGAQGILCWLQWKLPASGKKALIHLLCFRRQVGLQLEKTLNGRRSGRQHPDCSTLGQSKRSQGLSCSRDAVRGRWEPTVGPAGPSGRQWAMPEGSRHGPVRERETKADFRSNATI